MHLQSNASKKNVNKKFKTKNNIWDLPDDE